MYARVRAKQHQAAIRLWIPDYFDAHSNASAFAWNDGKSSTVAGLNGWKIPELNKATLAAVAEPDPAKRLDLYKKMQEQLQHTSPYVFVDRAKLRSWCAITSRGISRAERGYGLVRSRYEVAFPLSLSRGRGVVRIFRITIFPCHIFPPACFRVC